MAIQIQARDLGRIITCNHNGTVNSHGQIVPLNVVLTLAEGEEYFVFDAQDILDSFCEENNIVPSFTKAELELSGDGRNRVIYS